MNTEQHTLPENKSSKKLILELLIIFAFAFAVYMFASSYDVLERIVEFTHQYENSEFDEFITVSLFMVLALALFSMRRWQEARKANNALLQHSEILRKTISDIKQLKGIIPICGRCKDIRYDDGYWQQVEAYIREHSEVEFSHSICPECVKKEYPSLHVVKGDKHS